MSEQPSIMSFSHTHIIKKMLSVNHRRIRIDWRKEKKKKTFDPRLKGKDVE